MYSLSESKLLSTEELILSFNEVTNCDSWLSLNHCFWQGKYFSFPSAHVLGAIQKACHRPRGEGGQAKQWCHRLLISRKVILRKYLCFIVRLLIFKVWTNYTIILIGYAPLLLVVLAYLQEARLCKCRTRSVYED